MALQTGSSDGGAWKEVRYAAGQTDAGSRMGDAMTGQLLQASMDQLRQTMVTGQLKMVTSLGEGIAKTFKALGDAVKGLC